MNTLQFISKRLHGHLSVVNVLMRPSLVFPRMVHVALLRLRQIYRPFRRMVLLIQSQGFLRRCPFLLVYKTAPLIEFGGFCTLSCQKMFICPIVGFLVDNNSINSTQYDNYPTVSSMAFIVLSAPLIRPCIVLLQVDKEIKHHVKECSNLSVRPTTSSTPFLELARETTELCSH